MSLSHDGFPLGCVERSSHLEEYSRSRPASAGSRPRSLLNKMANAAAAVQQEDEPEASDAEPWVLEGWGDGPSVSEAAQQAALRLGPYMKNVPTTLVGLGAAGRRVLSAGQQGRATLKVSEARRKLGSGQTQGQERRASGPAALAHIATVRRTQQPRDLEVGDESDVEPSSYSSSAGPAGAYGYSVGQGPPGPSRAPPMPRTISTATAQARHLPLAQQATQQTVGGGQRSTVRRETAAGTPCILIPSGPSILPLPWPTAANDGASTSNTSPRHRSLSAEAYHSHGAAGPSSRTAHGATARASGTIPGPTALLQHAAQAMLAHPPVGPPAPGHLEALHSTLGRFTAPRIGPSDCGAGSTDRQLGSGTGHADVQALARGTPSSGTVKPLSPTAGDPHPHASFPGGVAIYGSSLSQHYHHQHLQPISPGSVHAAPPPLPGLFHASRRANSFRTDTGLSGWDPEAPAVQPLQTAQTAASGSLWNGSHPSGAAVGLHIGPAPGSRPAPLQISPVLQVRREQASSNSRVQRGGSMSAAELSLVPEKQQIAVVGRPPVRAQTGGLLFQGQPSQTMSPDGPSGPPGFAVPQQDALSEFCATRAEIGSAGVGSASMFGSGESRGNAGAGHGLFAGMTITVPMRVTSLTKPSATVAHVT